MASQQSSSLASVSRPVHDISDSDEEQAARKSPSWSSSIDVIPDTDSENECRTPKDKCLKRKLKRLSKTLHKAQREKDLFGSDSDNEITKRRKTEEAKKDQNAESGVHDISTDELSAEDEKPPKAKCPYGLKCYRKNPSHFAEYDHPQSIASDNTKKCNTHDSSKISHLGIHFTKVTGIADQYNGAATVGIRDILSPKMGKLQRSAQFNYCIDVDWVVAQYPREFKSCPLLIVHGSQRGEKATLDLAASQYDNVRMCQAKMEIPYGTHHTKMMLLLYENGLRVVIHTANLVERDWYQKTQGAWISPLYPKMTGGHLGDSTTNFKQDLIEYLSAYKLGPLNEWVDIIKEYDMSQTNVCLIGSIPGRHTGSRKSAFGHLKLRKILQQHGPSTVTKDDAIIGQFSSVGSMGANKEAWLCGEWLNSLGSSKTMGVSNQPKLKLIFPTRDNIRLSLEGYPAGQSVPYSASVAKKQIFLHKFFHQWRSEHLGRSRASPHIKTFLRTSHDSKGVYWMLLTSCNLSKAAWGAYEKQQSQLMIRSYELGVLLLPKFVDASKTNFTVAGSKVVKEEDGDLQVTVPFDLPPVPYGPSDQPWIWDIPYVKQPDSHGNMWCPR